VPVEEQKAALRARLELIGGDQQKCAYVALIRERLRILEALKDG